MKKITYIILAVLMILFLTSCQDTGSDSQPENETLTLNGVIADINGENFKLVDDAGEELVFPLGDMPVLPEDKQLIKGDTVAIYYSGALDQIKAIQDVEVSKIEIVKSDPVEEKIQDIIVGMTLDEKCAQLFYLRCPEDDAVSVAENYQPGGYILFARDFQDKSKTQVIDEIKSYQEVVKIPLLIGTDEEGGTVNRVSKYKEFRDTPFQSPQALYNEGGFDLIKSDALEKCQLLKRLGVNVNFAPVCDVSTDKNDFIYRRSFGQDATMTSQYVKTVVGEMGSEKMGSVLKHFPGYGNNRDTHSGSAYDERNLETFRNVDFLPFKAGIEAGAGCVLVCHNVVQTMDPDIPASLSPEVHRLLREELGFDGVVVTDDLSMQAITDYTDAASAAVLAFEAGNDMLLSSNYQEQIGALTAAVDEGEIREAEIDQALRRVLKWKISLGLI